MAASIESRTNISREVQDYFSTDRRRNQVNHTESDTHVVSDSARTEAPRESPKPSKCDSLGILTDRPKYRQYGILDSRIASFENWPDTKTQDKKELAEAGFAYTGVDDSVRCFYCSIGLRDWPEGACPWEQHILASSKCAHVIQCKGKAFIRKILGDDLSDSDVDDSEVVVDTVQLAINRNRDSVSVAREYCLNEDVLKTAIKAMIKNDLQKKFTAVELVKAIDVIQERNEETEKHNQHVDDEESDDLETDGECSDTEEDIKENRKLKEPITCKICLNAVACIITLLCGHLVSCSQCVSALTKCAVCRAQIKGTVRALMAI